MKNALVDQRKDIQRIAVGGVNNVKGQCLRRAPWASSARSRGHRDVLSAACGERDRVALNGRPETSLPQNSAGLYVERAKTAGEIT